MNATNKQYGSVLSAQYNLAGGKPVNYAQIAQDLLQKKNLPGQGIAGYLAKSSASDPTNVARSKMSLGQPLTDHEKKLIESASLNMVAGMTSPLEPGTRNYQDVSNEVYQLGLKNKQNFLTPTGKIDLEAMGKVQELANKYLPKQAINEINKTTPIGSRISAYLDHLGVLTQ